MNSLHTRPIHRAMTENRDIDLRLPRPETLGRILCRAGVLSKAGLQRAVRVRQKIGAPLADVLLAEGLVNEEALLRALAAKYHTDVVALPTQALEPTVAKELPVDLCLQTTSLPWRTPDGRLCIVTAQPDLVAQHLHRFPAALRNAPLRIAGRSAILQAVHISHGHELAKRAETRLDAVYSCRSWRRPIWQRAAYLVVPVLLICLGLVFARQPIMTALIALTVFTLVLSVALKLCAFVTQCVTRMSARAPPSLKTCLSVPLPHISVMVPLLHEAEIAGALLKRLEAIKYPRALFEVVLVLEESDAETRATLARTALPDWIRVVEVPDTGGWSTKPRALNYALNFCRGEIIGVWDAEDAPDPQQIARVAWTFHHAPPDVVCLQGKLDYYNAKANWIARCFTIEYAAWWRIFIPGIARMGFAVPLGGTTLFIRRPILEELGGWDAHNVTEDADLGMRLARFGYRTSLIDTETLEEACCTPWAWVRQRSRWHKGFLMTYILNARSPLRLLADLGPWRCIGFHAFFVAALSQFLLAPLLWSFWLIPLGFPHPAQALIPDTVVLGLLAIFVFSELLGLMFHLVAVSGPPHRHLMKWTPTMILYFPLATLAVYKAVYELIARPFSWEKTRHGVVPPDPHHQIAAAGQQAALFLRHPANAMRRSKITRPSAGFAESEQAALSHAPRDHRRPVSDGS